MGHCAASSDASAGAKPWAPRRLALRCPGVPAAADSGHRGLSGPPISPPLCLCRRATSACPYSALLPCCWSPRHAGARFAAAVLLEPVPCWCPSCRCLCAEDLRRWLIAQECDLFRARFREMLPSEQVRLYVFALDFC